MKSVPTSKQLTSSVKILNKASWLFDLPNKFYCFHFLLKNGQFLDMKKLCLTMSRMKKYPTVTSKWSSSCWKLFRSRWKGFAHQRSCNGAVVPLVHPACDVTYEHFSNPWKWFSPGFSLRNFIPLQKTISLRFAKAWIRKKRLKLKFPTKLSFYGWKIAKYQHQKVKAKKEWINEYWLHIST